VASARRPTGERSQRPDAVGRENRHEIDPGLRRQTLDEQGGGLLGRRRGGDAGELADETGAARQLAGEGFRPSQPRAHVRPDPRHQLADVGRLEHVVVGAGLQPAKAVGIVGGAGEQDHRQRTRALIGPQPLDDRHPVDARQVDVEEDQPDLLGFDPLQRLEAVLSLARLEAAALERANVEAAHHLVVGDQHG
jgi:hypothetical protein